LLSQCSLKELLYNLREVELFLQGRSYPPSAWPRYTEVKAVEKRKQQEGAREQKKYAFAKTTDMTHVRDC